MTLTYTTHSEGGLTDKDFDGARATAIAARRWAAFADVEQLKNTYSSREKSPRSPD